LKQEKTLPDFQCRALRARPVDRLPAQ